MTASIVSYICYFFACSVIPEVKIAQIVTSSAKTKQKTFKCETNYKESVSIFLPAYN